MNKYTEAIKVIDEILEIEKAREVTSVHNNTVKWNIICGLNLTKNLLEKKAELEYFTESENFRSMEETNDGEEDETLTYHDECPICGEEDSHAQGCPEDNTHFALLRRDGYD